MVSRASRRSSGPCSMACSSKASTAGSSAVGLARHLLLHRGVGLRLEQLRHLQRAGEPPCELLVRGDPPLERLDLLDRGPGALGIGPEGRVRLRRLQRPEPVRLGGQVKESLGVRVTRCCSSVRRSTRSAMPATPTTRGQEPGRERASRSSARTWRRNGSEAEIYRGSEDLATAGEDLVQRFLEVRGACRPRPSRPARRTPPSSS